MYTLLVTKLVEIHDACVGASGAKKEWPKLGI